MKYVSARDLRANSGDIWRDLPEEREMVVTSNGRPVALITAVNETSLEESLAAIRQARAVMAVTAMQRASVERGAEATTDADIDTEITAARAERSR